MTLKQQIIFPLLILFILTFSILSVVSIFLISDAVESRISNQMHDLSSFITNTNFPMNKQVLTYVKEIFGADIVVVDGKTVYLTTLLDYDSKVFINVIDNRKLYHSTTDVNEINVKDITYQMVRSPIKLNKVNMTLYLLFPGDIIYNEKKKAILPFLIITLVGILLVVVAGYIIAHRIATPIAKLADRTKEIATGDLTMSVDTNSNTIEILKLTDSFNKMINGLRSYQENLLKSEKLALTGQLALSIAHEIRNPLTSMKMSIQMLSATQSDRNKEYYDLLLREIGRLELAVSELLSAAHPSKLQFEPANINELIEDMLYLMQKQFEHLSINVEKHLSELPHTIIDKNRFKRAIMNLILNGVQAMPKGGKLTISTNVVDSKVRLSIKDTGNGIPPEVVDKVFEPFVTTKRDGVGLGLAITKNIVEEHKGSISFKTESDGTEFWVFLTAK